MPLREQSRIKADTVAEECTCEECPAPAPEPSAPPAGVPVCKDGCGTRLPFRGSRICGDLFRTDDGDCHCVRDGDDNLAFCSKGCAATGRPLNPPPSDPATVATGGPVSTHPAPFAHDCDIVPGDEIPTAEECAETVKRLGIDVPAWAADVRKRVAAVATGGDCPGCDDHCEDEKCPAAHGPCVDAPVATGGVPSGHRLGAGWGRWIGHGVEGRLRRLHCDTCLAEALYVQTNMLGATATSCAAHAVEMGALVPIGDTREGWRKRYVDLAAAQADAIKAAVDKANNRAADAFDAWDRRDESVPAGTMSGGEFVEWLRSGEDAPGAVTP